MMVVKFLSGTLCLVIFLFVVELVRRGRLTFKYAAGWILASLLGLFFTIFDHLLFRVASFFGFQLTSNFVFFALLGVFVLSSLFLTIFLCQQDNRNDLMAQKIGQLEFELEQLKKKSHSHQDNA